MSLDIYWEGHEAGAQCANDSKPEIRKSSRGQALGVLAGAKLENRIRRNILSEKDAYWRSQAWRTGFFDGFLDRAESVLSSRA